MGWGPQGERGGQHTATASAPPSHRERPGVRGVRAVGEPSAIRRGFARYVRGCWGVALLLLANGLSLPRAAGDDWLEFRGPTGQGHATQTGLPVRWTERENVAWKQLLPGKGWSSPIIKQGKIYVTTAVPVGDGELPPQSLRALGVDAESGRVEWNVELFEQPAGIRVHGKNSHASSTPACDGRRLYVHFGTHGTACLELDGTVVWRNTGLKYAPVHGNGGSPVLHGELVIVNCDGADTQFVVGLDRGTGEVRWKHERGLTPKKGFAFCTPLLVEVDGVMQLISPGADGVCGLNPTTGAELWRVRYAGGYSVVPRPVAGGGFVYVCTGYDAPTLLAIRLAQAQGDVTDTHVAWKLAKRVPLNPSPLLVGDELYLVSDDGILSCLDSRTGESKWQQRLGGAFSASPTLANGKIYLQSEQGETVVVEPAAEYREVSRSQIGDKTFASYAIAGGAIYLRTETALFRLQEGVNPPESDSSAGSR